MQQYVTPLPGRTPPQPNITDREDYKLDVRVTSLPKNQFMVTIRRYIPETGWVDTKLFLEPEEMVRLQRAMEEIQA